MWETIVVVTFYVVSIDVTTGVKDNCGGSDSPCNPYGVLLYKISTDQGEPCGIWTQGTTVSRKEQQIFEGHGQDFSTNRKTQHIDVQTYW